jgi:putative hydrolase of the HAD superfamily
MIRAVLFDAVGTLMRPYPTVGSVYSRVAASCGVDCRPGVLQREFREAYRELMPRRFHGAAFGTSEALEKGWWKAAVKRTFDRVGCTPVPAAVVEGCFEAFASGRAWRLYADVLPLLDELKRRGVSLGIVSNFDSRLRGVVGDLGLDRYGFSLTISSETRFAKPSPRIYRAALESLGAAPGATLFVGDRRKQDYDGPRRAGLHALWLVRDGSRRGRGVVRSLRGLAGRLGKPLP